MQNKINQFWNLLHRIKKSLSEQKVSDSLKCLIRESGMEEFLKNSDVDGEERLLNVRELVSVATQYDHMIPLEGVEALLANAALASDQDDLEKNENAVKLMTVHASKGLEFSHIFIAGLEKNLFPFKHIDEDDISASQEEEERRLFYVALTRAKEKVWLSHSMIRTVYGSQRVNAPSEFILDIGDNLIENQEIEKPSGARAIFIDF